MPKGIRFENLIMHILLPKDPHLRSNYVFEPIKTNGHHKHLGDYERLLLEKFQNPPLPTLCIIGDMGSGKTTTINYLIKYYLKSKRLTNKDISKPISQKKRKKMLIGHIDFLRHFRGKDEKGISVNDVLNLIAQEMRAKINSLSLLTTKEELSLFWDYLLDAYDDERVDIMDVVRPLWADIDTLDGVSVRSRVLDNYRSDLSWYLRYLVLLWSYLFDESSITHKKLSKEHNISLDTGVIILDNLDSLAPRIQRLVFDSVLGFANPRGPAFVLLMRPETFVHLTGNIGKSDNLVDRVYHEGPLPRDVIKFRLSKFLEQPTIYYRKTQLEKWEQELVLKFSTELIQEMNKDSSYFDAFISSATGASIRLGLVLSQGIFFLPRKTMERRELTPHFIIRSCITQGERHYKRRSNSPVENVFRVVGCETDIRTILLKLRILQYLNLSTQEERDNSNSNTGSMWENKIQLSKLRNSLVVLGYSGNEIKSAINQLLRKQCQLIASDGENSYGNDWEIRNDILTITRIGQGYYNNLIFSVNYLQEIAWDCGAYPVLGRRYANIPDDMWDRLSIKFEILYSFLHVIHEVDCRQTKLGLERFKSMSYKAKFGEYLITSQIIQSASRSVRNILGTSINRYPHNASVFNDVILDFESLAIQAQNIEDELGFGDRGTST